MYVVDADVRLLIERAIRQSERGLEREPDHGILGVAQAGRRVATNRKQQPGADRNQTGRPASPKAASEYSGRMAHRLDLAALSTSRRGFVQTDSDRSRAPVTHVTIEARGATVGRQYEKWLKPNRGLVPAFRTASSESTPIDGAPKA